LPNNRCSNRFRAAASVRQVGQGDGDDLVDPPRLQDGVDLLLDGRFAAAGLPAAKDRLQVLQLPCGFGQGLVEPAGLLGVQRR
jgi:hypothetical protein